jgi:hypothetical protein
MSIQSAWQQGFDFFGRLPIIVEPSQALLTSDAGLLPIWNRSQKQSQF